VARARSDIRDVRDPSLDRVGQRNQVRRAWTLLLCGFLILVTILAFAVGAVRAYMLGATQQRTATLEPVSGQGLLLRARGQDDWRLVSEPTTIREGDTVSTGSGSVGWITLFDQGTIEISENSVIRISRLRTSQLLREHKEVEIESIRGIVHIGMAPRGEFNSAVTRVTAGPVTVRMRDEIRVQEAGSFLVETQRIDPVGDESDPLLAVRVAVVRGAAQVESNGAQRFLTANQQSIISANGQFGEVTGAVRELIRNGDFSRHLADWVEYQDPGDDGGTVAGLVERVSVETPFGRQVAVEFSRDSAQQDHWETGIQQRIGQSVRVHSSLSLTADIRIDAQQPPGGGRDHTEFPLIFKISYIDVHGQAREWWHGFYVLEDPGSPVPVERGTRIPRGSWERVSLDLRNLTPLPLQISSVAIFSSGHSFTALVTNISITSGEAGEADDQ
jgi:hypothetical protein